LKIGTKSVLYGAHCFLFHPWFVALAWWRLYGFPWDPRLWVAFFVHDIGYIGKPNMDGPEGELHPFLGARIMQALFDRKLRFPESVTGYSKLTVSPWFAFTLYHSRFLAKSHQSRIKGTISAVRAQRVQDISEADAKAEGAKPWVEKLLIGELAQALIPPGTPMKRISYVIGYEHLWDSINTDAGDRWQDNPPIWAYTLSPTE
jgi:hypothetical protein